MLKRASTLTNHPLVRNAVPLARRLAILEEREKAVVLGGDATPDMLLWINWGTLDASYIPWTTALQLATERCLRHTGVKTDDAPGMMISIQELLWTVVAFAESCDHGVRHALHIHCDIAILDNQNAVAWIRKRRPWKEPVCSPFHTNHQSARAHIKKRTHCSMGSLGKQHCPRRRVPVG